MDDPHHRTKMVALIVVVMLVIAALSGGAYYYFVIDGDDGDAAEVSQQDLAPVTVTVAITAGDVPADDIREDLLEYPEIAAVDEAEDGNGFDLGVVEGTNIDELSIELLDVPGVSSVSSVPEDQTGIESTEN